jgi:hypothetical protein
MGELGPIVDDINMAVEQREAVFDCVWLIANGIQFSDYKSVYSTKDEIETFLPTP